MYSRFLSPALITIDNKVMNHLPREPGMDLEQLLYEIALETSDIEFKHENEDHTDIVKELTAFANSGGGAIVVGVTERGSDFVVTGVGNPQELEERVSQTIDRRVSPRFDPTVAVDELEGELVVVLEVSGGSSVHSFGLETPCFPARQGSTTIYLDGEDLRYQYRHQLSVAADERNADDLSDIGEQQHRSLASTDHWLDYGSHYIPKPNGTIAGICTFGELYVPDNPVRIAARANRPSIETVEHILTCLNETFQLHDSRSHFTINQNKGAWIGSGLSNFFEEIESQERRYAEAGLDTSDLYKCEEALYVANTSIPYPESLLVVYVEPWVSENVSRHFNIVLLTSGIPVDTEPLTEFSNKAGIQFGTGKPVEAEYKFLPEPDNIPVKPVERVHSSGIENNGRETVGFLTENPFYGEEDLAARLLGIAESTPLAEFQYTFAHFLQLPPEKIPEITTERFSIIDYGEFAELPLSAAHVDFQLGW